jgi:hypothetical protein
LKEENKAIREKMETADRKTNKVCCLHCSYK